MSHSSPWNIHFKLHNRCAFPVYIYTLITNQVRQLLQRITDNDQILTCHSKITWALSTATQASRLLFLSRFSNASTYNLCLYFVGFMVTLIRWTLFQRFLHPSRVPFLQPTGCALILRILRERALVVTGYIQAKHRTSSMNTYTV